MCGIAGSLSFNSKIITDIDQLKKFASVLKFRGPDAEGFLMESFNTAELAFAHKRLSIIDLDPSANQPMSSLSQKSIIVFNGEIYNYASLRGELIQVGVEFKTHSDTEVLLNGFEKWGIKKLLDKIDGMFAFALFDKETQSLYIAKDRFGKKPLYYYCDESKKQLAFSSDIRSFYNLSIDLHINMHALGYYFAELSTPEESSIWNKIKKLKPGHYAKLNNSEITINKYWNLNFFPKANLKREEIIEQSEKLLNDAIKKRTVSDVGYSAFLSGGIDSSLVTALLAKNSSLPINTYTVGFDDKDFDESQYARKVAKMYGTNHHEFIVNPGNMDIVNQLIEECGEPFADSSVIPTYFICKEVAKNEKVVLSGDGGDELFAGYYEYYQIDRVEKYKFLKPLKPLIDILPSKNSKFSFLKELLNDAKLPEYNLLHRNGMGFNNDQLPHLNVDFLNTLNIEHQKIWDEYSKGCPTLLDKALGASLHTRLVNDYLVKVDRASMFCSLEVRSPFLDKNLAEFVSKINHNQLLYKGITKSITKDIAMKLLPKENVNRRKQGFGIPIGSWIRKEFKTEITDTFNSANSNLINKEYANHILKRHLNGENLTHKVWSLYVFYKWSKKYLNN